MENEHQRGRLNSFRDGTGNLYMVVCWVQLCFTPFLRCNFGANSIGAGLMALSMLLFLAASAQSPAMFLYTALWLVVVFCRRVQTWLRARRGIEEHSRYTGLPYSVKLVGSERLAKVFADPIICLMAGMVVGAASPLLGGFIAWAGGLSLFFCGLIDGHIAHMRIRRMKDAQIEHKQFVNELRH